MNFNETSSSLSNQGSGASRRKTEVIPATHVYSTKSQKLVLDIHVNKKNFVLEHVINI